MKKLYFLIPIFFMSIHSIGQNKYVAVTMDDMPFNAMANNITLKQIQQINTTLLSQINQQQTPVAAFVNGNRCLSSDQTDLRLAILKSWLYHPYVTVGSHTMKHLNHAEGKMDSFKEDILTNEYLLKSLMKDSTLKYFRFPFNALGKDSAAQKERADYLGQRGYITAPFTIESSDYIFNALYINELTKKNLHRADSIAKAYIKFTLDLFQYFEKLSQELYGRTIPHVFLCHANKLHADYYTPLIKGLKEKGYGFISLDKALTDVVYTQPIWYFKKFGVSWIYRWIKDDGQRRTLLKKELEVDKVLYEEYQKLMGEK